MIKPVTEAIHENEKAWSLREQNMVRPPTHQVHRWQIITVVRNDKLAEWWNDLGPAAEFRAPGIEIPALFEHSVAELRDIATEYRLGDDYWRKRTAELSAESTLVKDWLEQMEEDWRVIRNQSSFGPGVSKQRNGFDRRAVKP